MPLKNIFQDKFDQLDTFLETKGQVVCCVRLEEDVKRLFYRVIAAKMEDDDYPHAFSINDSPFTDPDTYFRNALQALNDEFAQYEDDLKELGIDLNALREDSGRHSPAQQYIQFASALSDAFPDEVGSLALIIDPEAIEDLERWQVAIAFLATKTSSDWVKYLVLESRREPQLTAVEKKVEQVTSLVFHVSNEEIEDDVNKDMEHPETLSPLERRRYLAMQAGFAFSKKDYKRAGALQEQSIEEAEESEEPQEIALAHYNLGNTRFAEERFEDAEDCYTIAANVALDNELHQLGAMSFTNLGVTMHRMKRIPEAADFFKVARDLFKALRQPPGEAHALDCLARMCKEENGYDRAEEYWLEAYKVYEAIQGKPMAEMRISGCEDVLNKLEEMYRDSGQRGKIPQVKQLRERLNNG